MNALFFYLFRTLFIPKEILLCIYPIQACPSSGGQARSSRQPLVQRRGPTLVVVITGQMTIFCMYFSEGLYMEHRGEHSNSTQKGPFFLRDSPPGPGGNLSQDLLAVRRQLFH